MSDDDDFWSSTGSGRQQEEYLLYRLASPHSYVSAVQIAIYRAEYQLGCVRDRMHGPATSATNGL